MDAYIAFFIVAWLIFGIWAFWLSFSCYNPYDQVPIGLKLMHGAIAFCWNLVYILWYFISAYIFGFQCPSAELPENG